MPQLNELLMDTAVGTVSFYFLFFDILTLVDQQDDDALLYIQICQL